MKKAVSLTVGIIVFLLSSVCGFAYPKITHMVYDNLFERMYVFSQSDNKSDVTDAGLYLNGKKYSMVKDAGDSGKIAKINSTAGRKYGMGFISPENLFENVILKSYVVENDGTEYIGEPQVYNPEERKLRNQKTLFFENFTGYEKNGYAKGLIPRTYTDATSGVTKYADEDGVVKNMLFFNDKSTTNTTRFDLTLPEYKGVITFEMKIKFIKTSTVGFGMMMDFTGNGNRAFRVIKYADSATNGLTYICNSTMTVSGKNTEFDGEWFTIRMRIDSDRHINQMLMQNRNFGVNTVDLSNTSYVWQNKKDSSLLAYNLMWYNEFADSGEKIDKISVYTYAKSCGEYYIDYIRVLEDEEEYKVERVRAPSKYIERIPDPKP